MLGQYCTLRHRKVEYSSLVYVAILLPISFAFAYTDSCPNNLTTEINATFDVTVLVDVKWKNLSTEYNITILYTWEISHDVKFDGFLYKVHDEDKSSTESHGLSFIGQPFSFDPTPRCEAASGKSLWVARNNSETQCEMPCDGYLSVSCQSDRLCVLLNDDSRSMKKSRRSVSYPAEFGRKYELTMYPYHGRVVGNALIIPDIEPVFCGEELISNWNISIEQAQNFCKRKQKIAETVLASGPPVDLRKDSEDIELEKNRGGMTFRWRAPYDISDEVQLILFDIYVDGGTPDKRKIKFIDANHTYSVTISDIVFGMKGRITVTPRFSSCPGSLCVDHGAKTSSQFFIPDLDACDLGNRYCDNSSTCIDLPAKNTTPALCTCLPGYFGNGIKVAYQGGTGCSDYDACIEKQGICHEDANCTDSPAPNITALCECPPTHFGDGYINGTGCMSYSFFHGLGIGIPLAVITTIAICVIMWRSKVNRKRAIQLAFSKFIVTRGKNAKSVITTESDAGIEMTSAEGTLFGELWEIDRSKIELQSVIGRGGFGVVYKAVLATGSSSVEKVAVKSSLDSSEAERRGLICEISIMTNVGTHENIMSMIGCCTVDPKSIWMITKFMKYGDLLHFLWDARDVTKVREDRTYDLTVYGIYEIGKQCARGLNYLMELKILHGDVAARNVLVDEGLQCKISDFGLSNDVYQNGMITGAKEKRLPLKWAGPERIMDGKVPITWRSDVWSYGVLLYEIVTFGSSPYPGIPAEELFLRLQAGERMKKPVTCNNTLYDMMLRCWEWSPSKRPSFRDLAIQLDTAASVLGNKGQDVTSMVNALDFEANQAQAEAVHINEVATTSIGWSCGTELLDTEDFSVESMDTNGTRA